MTTRQTQTPRPQAPRPQAVHLAGQYRSIGSGAILAALMFIRRSTTVAGRAR